MTTDSPGWPDDLDAEILDGLRDIHDQLDPMPADLDELVIFALAAPQLDAELARIVDTELIGSGARGAGRVHTVSFEAAELTVMITVVELATGRVRVDGWLAPARAGTVQLRTPDQTDAEPVQIDVAGRFVIDDVAAGPAQLVLRIDDTTVVTPAVRL